MSNGCVVCTDLEGNTCYRIRFSGVDIMEPLSNDLVSRNEGKLEEVAEKISEEIVNGTFDYSKWFPDGILIKLSNETQKRIDSVISSYGPYLWSLTKDRISYLENQKKLLEDELRVAKNCLKEFTG